MCIRDRPRGAHPSIAPSQMIKTRDGWAMMLCQTQKFWEQFCEAADAAALRNDPRFQDIASRRRNIAALTEALDEIFSREDTGVWLDRLAGIVPVAPVKTLPDALANPFVAEVGMRDVVDHPLRPEGLHLLACPIKVNNQRMPGRRAPALGEHDAEILGAVKAAGERP